MDKNRAFDHMVRASELVENAEGMVFYSVTSKGSTWIDIAEVSLEDAIKELQEAKKHLR